MRHRRLFIVGAGEFGREVESWLEESSNSERDWNIHGYLDDNELALDGYPSDYRILGRPLDYSFLEEDLVVLAIAEPSVKEKLYYALKSRVNFLTFVANDLLLGKFNEIGEGSIICPRCIITTNVKIGKCVTVNVGTNLGHDVEIGDFSSIMGRVSLNGGVTIGSGVFVGSKATIIPKIHVGNNALVGAGSVVIKRVKSNTTVFGNPARLIKS